MSVLRHVPGKSRGGRQVKKKRTCREEDGKAHKEVRGMIRLQAVWINERGDACGEIWKALSGIGGGWRCEWVRENHKRFRKGRKWRRKREEVTWGKVGLDGNPKGKHEGQDQTETDCNRSICAQRRCFGADRCYTSFEATLNNNVKVL